MNCEEAKLKVQSLVDTELLEEEISEVINHIQSCYKCRDDYVQLLKLQRKMKGVGQPEPSTEWFEAIQSRVGRKISSVVGQIVFIGSYIMLFGYAIASLFVDKGEGLFIKVVFGGILLGVFVILGVTIVDRIKESKTDKYKGVMK